MSSGTRKPRFMGSTASAQSSFSPVVVAPEEGMMDILDMAKLWSFPLGYWKGFWKLVWFAIELKRTIDPSCICSKHQFHRKSLILRYCSTIRNDRIRQETITLRHFHGLALCTPILSRFNSARLQRRKCALQVLIEERV